MFSIWGVVTPAMIAIKNPNIHIVLIDVYLIDLTLRTFGKQNVFIPPQSFLFRRSGVMAGYV